ncbi:Ig-like domain-containing protein [Flavisolibacter sp. BT320]|nr:Ig-like domain-containing protein [Flavisolibacter longurius]
MRQVIVYAKPGLFLFVAVHLLLFFSNCSKKESPQPPAPTPTNFLIQSWKINKQESKEINFDISVKPVIELNFTAPVSRNSVAGSILLKKSNGSAVKTITTYTSADNTVIISPEEPLEHITKYEVVVATSLKSSNGGGLTASPTIQFLTSIDSSRKFPLITDDSLLTLVQKQTFKYFWDFAHPVSGLARERNTSGDVVTSGGSGFGIMAIVTAIHRGFITRAEGLQRMQTIVSFLKNTAQMFKGAYPHWLHGTTGAVQPFSAMDNGADLVETSFLMQGLLTARQYFTGADAAETALRNDINTIWQRVDWAWFRKGGENTLYWHWSPNNEWAINMPVKGWHEGLITYVLAASSPTHSIPKIVYDNGWATNGAMRNGKTFYGTQLPLGPDFGGPLFLSHYSFLGIDPRGLSDAYAASYLNQNVAHAKINHQHSINNPNKFFGYSDSTWGLTASDIQNGYTASSPTNDVSVIAPTAALASFPYTPTESMKALKFFYYVLGDKIWKDYGFVDAFSLHNGWFATSHLAIDQGPIIVMIENHRSSLLWNLFMSAPEVKAGMKALGFSSPHF